MTRAVILGAGVMGTAFGLPLSDRGMEVRLVGTHLDRDLVVAMKETRVHPRLKAEIGANIAVYQDSEMAEAFAEPADLIGSNPLGKIPVLILDDGRSVFDSAAIMQFLNRETKSALYPRNAVKRTEAEVLESLTRIAINRIGISVDDFGTGFASIERLRDFAYSELKIDRSFAASGHHDTFADASVRASILLGRNLGMRIVAEGIETREQWDYIVKAGVDEVQGFLVGKPMRGDDFLAWYRSCDGVAQVEAA